MAGLRAVQLPLHVLLTVAMIDSLIAVGDESSALPAPKKMFGALTAIDLALSSLSESNRQGRVELRGSDFLVPQPRWVSQALRPCTNTALLWARVASSYFRSGGEACLRPPQQ